MWGDWAVHFTFINHLRVQPLVLWFARNPLFVLAPFTYPPVSSIIPAVLMRFGLSLWWAVIVPSVFATYWFMWQLWRWMRLHKLSERLSFLGASLFLLSGAWGHIQWLKDGWDAFYYGDWGKALSYPEAFVTKDFDKGIDWVNPIVSMMLPQRAFLLGFPLLLFILRRIYTKIHHQSSTADWSSGIDLGLLSFLLLLTHSHSFFALGVLSTVWTMVFWRRWKLWLSFALSTGLLVVPWYFAVMSSDVGGALAFTWNIGWMSPNPFQWHTWLWFWLVNWGWFLPATVVALGVLVTQKMWSDLRWYSAFVFLFLFANVVNTQRWEWDNTKLFVTVLIGFVPLILQSWSRVWNLIHKKWGRLVLGLVLMILVLAQILPGFIDLLQLSQPKRVRWEIASPRDMAFAKKVEAVVPATSPVLTGDLHNQPTSMLAGRTLILGFQGWVWSYGFNYHQTAEDVKQAYGDVYELGRVLNKYGARYVVVGPHEHWQFGNILAPENACDEVAREQELALFDCWALLEK